MNDLQIEYFLTSARNLSFSRAAQELFVSQPAVSRQVLSLEEELGCPLFERKNKGIRLTANGEAFYEFFEEYRTGLNHLKMRAKLSMENKNRIIRMGVLNNSNISHILLPVLERFYQVFPDVKVEVNCYEPRKAVEALQTGKEDVVLTIEPKIWNIDGISSRIVTEISRVLLYNRARVEAQKCVTQLTPHDFREEPFLTVSDEEFDYVTDLIRDFCRPYGFVPKVQLVDSTDAMILGVQCGLGVAISDIWSRALDNASFGYLVLDSAHSVNLVWKNEKEDPALEGFVQLLEEIIPQKKRSLIEHYEEENKW